MGQAEVRAFNQIVTGTAADRYLPNLCKSDSIASSSVLLEYRLSLIGTALDSSTIARYALRLIRTLISCQLNILSTKKLPE